MSDAWAVVVAGGVGFCAACFLRNSVAQSKYIVAEIQKKRSEIRKTALLITTHTPKKFGGCGCSKSDKLAAAKLRQLHTGLAVRLSPGNKKDKILLDSIDLLIADIDNSKIGIRRHAEVIKNFAEVIAEKEKQRPAPGSFSEAITDFLISIYRLPEYLTEYDKDKKTN